MAIKACPPDLGMALTLEHIGALDKAALESLRREIEATLKGLPSLKSLGLSVVSGGGRWRWDNDIVIERMKLVMALSDVEYRLGLRARPVEIKCRENWLIVGRVREA